MLFRAILWAAKQEEAIELWIPKNINTECAYFPSSKKLVVINNGGEIETTFVKDETGNIIKVTLDEYGIKVIETT
jgi:beta-D-galactosyl-(1->4)-L-rhamnose phosphorylase